MSPITLAATQDGTITLAGDSNLRQGWDQGPGRIFASGFGQKAAIAMAVCAAIIACALLVALILKGRGSQSQLVTRYTSSAGVIASVIFLIIILVAPTFLLPMGCSLIDLLINALKSILQNVFG